MSSLNRVYYRPPPAPAFIQPHSTLICLKGFSKTHQAVRHQLREARDASAAHAAQPEEITKAEGEERAALLAKFPLLGRRQEKKKAERS